MGNSEKEIRQEYYGRAPNIAADGCNYVYQMLFNQIINTIPLIYNTANAIH